MSGTDTETPMEVDNNDNMNQPSAQSDIQQHPAAADKAAAASTVGEDETLAVLSLKWIYPVGLQRIKRLECCLQKMLQSWFNKCEPKVDCSVKHTLTDGRVVIKIKPAAAITELQKLSKQTLTGKDRSSVIVTSISLKLPPPEFNTQMPADALMNLPPSLPEPKAEQDQPGKQSNAGSAAGEESGTSSKSAPQTEKLLLGQQSSTASAAEEMPCSVPVGLYWYVNHTYKEEMKCIEEKNGVKIKAEVKVSFELDRSPGNPDKALDEFTNLVQNSSTEFSGSDIPLKFIDPDQWRDALKIMQKKENKLLVTLTSEEMTLRGPRDSRDVITKLLHGDAHQIRNTRASLEEYERETEDTALKINLTTKDRFPDEGLIMEESYWKTMTTIHKKHVVRIKEKFNVDLQDSYIGQGKVSVKAFYKKDGGNASMESHALKVLLNLYQKIAESSSNFSQSHGASGSSGSPMNIDSVSVYVSEGASNGLVLNGHSANRKHNTDARLGGGATAGDSEEERCPICLDRFKNKKRLNCKHEFCKECLQQAGDANGPICPVCRVVFGKIMGDQPNGNMSHRILPSSLPGFPHCNTIVINYEIPPGIQTGRHPNPGKPFYGISRTAYLPNNTEGKEVLLLLKRAFDQRLIFTIGTSRTTGMDGQVTWNDIHHKTSTAGGPQCFGYPDPAYLSRVKEELKAKGIE